MGIIETFLTLIGVAIAIVIGMIPFAIISRFFDIRKKPKEKPH